jgi:uncharacterized protein YkwD
MMGTKSPALFALLLITGCAIMAAYPGAAAAESSRPDLVVTGIAAPMAATPGENVNLVVTVQNDGTAYSSSSYTCLYLSRDTVVDPSDLYLARVFTSSLAPGSARSIAYSAAIPAGASGSWYVLAHADCSGRISEKDESNNGGISSLMTTGAIVPTSVPTTRPGSVPTREPATSQKPDLVIGAITAPSTAVAGEKATLSATIGNAGDVPASSSYVYYYLSADTGIDAADTYLGRVSVSSLSAGDSLTVSYSVTIPGRTSGQVYLCALADGNGRIPEKDEGNNAGCSTPVSVQNGQVPGPTPTSTPTPSLLMRSDLVALSVDGPATGTTGSAFAVQVSVRNGGITSSGSTGAAFYLSPDTVITPGDSYIGSLSVPSIPAGASVTASGNIVIPATVPAGMYYLGTIIDPPNEIRETDEGNNIACGSRPVQIVQSVPGDSVEAKVEAAIFNYTNQERIAAGLSPLAGNSVLTSVARAHSLDMKERNFFSHTNPDWISPFQRMSAAGYDYSAAAENIAAISLFTLNSNPDEVGRYFVQQMWMQSTGHKENILSPSYTEIGIGVVYESDRISSPYGFIATQNFGRPR